MHPHALPTATAVVAMTTMAICAITTMLRGDLPPWLVAPQISFLGCTGPERIVFQVGFGLTAVLLAANIATYVRAALPRFEQRLHTELKVAAGLAFAAAIGLGILGVVPLQRDCVALLEGRAPLLTESIVHQGAASLFFLASWVHGAVSIRLYRRSLATRVNEVAVVTACRWRMLLLALPIIGLAALIPAALAVSNDRVRMQMGAGHQWLSVAAMIGLYYTYAVDIGAFTRYGPGSDTAGSACASSGGSGSSPRTGLDGAASDGVAQPRTVDHGSTGIGDGDDRDAPHAAELRPLSGVAAKLR